MERYLRSTAATLPLTWSVNGVATDPAPTTTTVTVTREDGTALTSGTATRTGAGTYTFPLTAVQTTDLDQLTAAWTSSLGTLYTFPEIVGGFTTSLTELRATPGLTSTATYPTADLITARSLAESALEDACGVAFVPRYFREKIDGTGTADALLPARPLTITSVTFDASSASAGTTLTANELTDLRVYPDGRLYNPSGWSWGRKNIEVKGTRGYAQAPPRVGLAVRKLAKRWLMDTAVSDRATSMTNADGAYTYLLTSGVRGMVFDVPECQAVLDVYGIKDAY